MPNSHPKLTGDALEQAISDAARCKASRRHRFDPIPPPINAPVPSFGILFTQRCELCGTLRYDIISRFTGQMLSTPRYDWPEWYEETGGDGHDLAWWRAKYWTQLDDSLFSEGTTVTPMRRNRRRKAS